jgi:rod shape-determining protein MreD
LVLLAIFQSTIATHIRLFDVSPDLVLTFVVSWVLLEGAKEGIIASLVAGLILDGLSGAPFGSTTLALVVVSLLASLGQVNIFRSARLFPYITVVVATLVYCGISLFLLRMTGRVVIWGPTLVRIVLPAVLVNILCMPLVYNAVLWLHNHIHPRTVEWE